MSQASRLPLWQKLSRWGVCSGVLGLSWGGSVVFAQTPPAVPSIDLPNSQSDPEKAEANTDRFEDPLAADALKNTFPEIASANVSAADISALKTWANGSGSPDLAVIQRFVKNRAAELTKRSNIKALEDPAGNPANAKAIEKATIDPLGLGLIDPLQVPATTNNARFRSLYVATLLDVFKPIWKGNYHSRTMAMIVLSRCGDPQAIPVFTAQINDPEQTVVVKLLSAYGISTVAKRGQRGVDSVLAVPAAQALSSFLRENPSTFWPAQFRALEALGSLRLATAQPLGDKAEFADTAMAVLSNPKVSPNARVWAAWALGMMRIPNSVRDFNFPLIARNIAEVVIEVGNSIPMNPTRGMPRVKTNADLLVQLNLAFDGEGDEIRDSGILRTAHPAARVFQPAMMEIARKVKDITKATFVLDQSGGTQIAKSREDLATKIKDLQAFLAKNVPTSKALYAGGPEFGIPPSKAPKVDKP